MTRRLRRARTARVWPQLGAVTGSIAATVLAVMPIYLLGGLSAFVREDLDISAAVLGSGASVYFGTAALLSAAAGRFVESRDPMGSLRLAMALSVASLSGIALLGHRWGVVVAMLALGGAANAVVHPGASLAVTRRLPEGRRGMALGGKQAAIPATTILAGASVPTVAVTLGWRWVFVLVAIVGVAFLLLRGPWPGQATTVRAVEEEGEEARPWGLEIALLCVGTAFAAGAANAMPIFVVESLVSSGHEPAFAGAMLSTGSAVSIVSRLSIGAFADRCHVDRLGLLAGLMAIGSVGMLLFAVADTSLAGAVAGIVVGFGAGWGWQGLLHLAIISRYPTRPSSATGVVVIGVYVGSIAGPPALGWVIDDAGYPPAWLVGACSQLVGAVIVAKSALVRGIRAV